MNYSPSDAFETLPLCVISSGILADLTNEFEAARNAANLITGLGITDTLNLVHDPDANDPHIAKIRSALEALDSAVAKAYGWESLDLQHDFHEVSYLPDNDNIRFTISEEARIEVLQRLADLNKERYEEEEAQGLHGKNIVKKKSSRRKSKGSSIQNELDV